MDPTTARLLAASAGAAGAASKLYIEDVFSTFLYTGNGSTQTITNGIDLAGKGGLVWIKNRTSASLWDNLLFDSTNSFSGALSSNSFGGRSGATLSSVGSNGFTIGFSAYFNESGTNFASWTFRKAAKFFDVVTYTGNGSNRTIAHNLGSVPGCIIVKRTDTTGDWQVYHRSLANTEYLVLNSTAATATGATRWNSTTPTSTVFSLGTDATVNASNGTYVAYLFAHDAGGFGDSGNESVIKCGSYTGDRSSDRLINLGWEAQWVLIKPANSAIDWRIYDVMRGMPLSGGSNTLSPNSSSVEDNNGGNVRLYADPLGFRVNFGGATWTNETGINYIYIAIRRGPMKTPTDATKVFAASKASTGNNTPGFTTDNLWTFYLGGGSGTELRSRLQGNTPYLVTSSTAAQATGSDYKWDANNGVNYTWGSGSIAYYFRRAPGFFDVVAYTGTGSARTVSHNLGVAPEFLVVKSISTGGVAYGWFTYVPAIHSVNQYLELQRNIQTISSTGIWNTGVTSTTFGLGSNSVTNGSGTTFIAYLFASCPGVSKVGSYTGTGTTLQINCGFTNGARFVLIKRTDSTGDWYVWDTARGIVSANDPYLLLNSTAAEVTNTDYIDPYAAGFEISSTAPAAINANGGTYIYLSIA